MLSDVSVGNDLTSKGKIFSWTFLSIIKSILYNCVSQEHRVDDTKCLLSFSGKTMMHGFLLVFASGFYKSDADGVKRGKPQCLRLLRKVAH